MDTAIFCISVNCAPITAIMLKSFHKFHDRKIHIVLTPEDKEMLGDISNHPNNIFVDIGNDSILKEEFKHGHRGTARVFAMAIKKMFFKQDYMIHIDTDVVFLSESISLIEKGFEQGYDVVGARRCFKNNPSGVKGLDKYPDTISTYFFGINTGILPDYEFNKLCRYCEGAEHPLGWPALDFFDGVTHGAINQGSTVKYLDQSQVGSQDEMGKKNSKYELNLHMDAGSNLVHFGGTGSGYSYYSQRSYPQAEYAKWAVGRWGLFAFIFYGTVIDPSVNNIPTTYGADGRWINGKHDERILELVLKSVGA